MSERVLAQHVKICALCAIEKLQDGNIKEALPWLEEITLKAEELHDSLTCYGEAEAEAEEAELEDAAPFSRCDESISLLN
jgi:hypothetical protein